MMQTPDSHFEKGDQALEAPAELVSALQRLPQDQIFVPPTIDAAVLRAARQHLGRRGTARFTWLRFVPWKAGGPTAQPTLSWPRLVPWLAGAAAVIALTVIVLQSPRPTNYAREDMNRDGVVDILDAFVLARQLESGVNPEPKEDLNGDGTVDGQDVSLLAAQAVRLEKGGRS